MCTNGMNNNQFNENSIFNFEPQQQNRCRCQSEEMRPKRPCRNSNQADQTCVSQNVFLTGDLYQIKDADTVVTNDVQLNGISQMGRQGNNNCRVRQAYMQGYRQGCMKGCRQGYRKGFRDGYCQGVRTANCFGLGNNCCNKEAELNTSLSNSTTNSVANEDFFLF